MKVRKKPIVVEATQWLGHASDLDVERFGSQYTHVCSHCRNGMLEHGKVPTLEGYHIVCPGDWIITGVHGERYPCKPDIFAETYDILDEAEGTPP